MLVDTPRRIRELFLETYGFLIVNVSDSDIMMLQSKIRDTSRLLDVLHSVVQETTTMSLDDEDGWDDMFFYTLASRFW